MGLNMCTPCTNSVGIVLPNLNETGADANEWVINTAAISHSIRSRVSDKKWSEHLDKMIDLQSSSEKSIKVLLLGGTDAGKSTIVKQMRILHKHGFTDAEEIASCVRNIRYNIFHIYAVVADGILKAYSELQQDEIETFERFANGHHWIYKLTADQEINELLKIGQLSSIQRFLNENPNLPELPDNHAYFLQHLDRILSVSFAPTYADVLNVRVPSHAINELCFPFSKYTIRLIDVGGQRSYRKKWIHCFDGVAAVLFVASMAGYDQNLGDVDPTHSPVLHHGNTEQGTTLRKKNRLRASAKLYHEMLRNPFLKNAAFILFLNKACSPFSANDSPSVKKDLFERKLDSNKLADSMESYNGNNSYADASLFRKAKTDRDRQVYSHFTCATDTENVKFVFKAACDIVLLKRMQTSGVQG